MSFQTATPKLLSRNRSQLSPCCLRNAYVRSKSEGRSERSAFRWQNSQKRFVDAVEIRDKDYVLWDDDLPGFGLRVFSSGKRSYVIQYRAAGRSRRYAIGLHGVWTAETARKEAMAQLGKVARGENPAEERYFDCNAITVKELAEQYIKAMEAGLIIGKGGRSKRPSTIYTNIGALNGHIIPLIGQRRVQDLTKSDVTKMMNDVIAGKTAAIRKTGKKRGVSVLRGGRGTASKCVGLQAQCSPLRSLWGSSNTTSRTAYGSRRIKCGIGG